ncbi:hypothetical protein NUW58_g3329 [Xylaria curta]|uniref:Uncharacterized protein n=1 Tax=Xylaria curta TaxID=42375 RepID=A0ACC1PD01_9PEZI|nr:hypothetical protein NUW58_g3329 [Xylaria curta]
MGSFAYTPLNLDRSAFRLVRLQKGTAYEIHCELIATTLDENTITYEAVSYTWGSQGKPYSINIQGERLNITFNLWCILHDLRLREKDRYLWIDAISINQNDVAERAHQVQRMRKIYGNAECVLFCLGVASTESANIFLASLVYLRGETGGYRWPLNDAHWETAWENVRKSLRSDYGDQFEKRQQEGLEEILNKQWFRRVWILQEVASARRALILCYGAESVPSHIFVMGIRLMDRCLNEHSQSVVGLMPGPEGFSHMAYHSDLYSILIRFSKSEASDQRDRIYALLGLCTDGTPLKPDYEMSAEDIISALDQHMFGNSTWQQHLAGV